MKKVAALIPARSGSKGIKNKNILSLSGYSLLEWSIKACQKSKLIEKIIVSTDSQEYADIALQCGAEVPYLRPKDISGDSSSDYSFVKHFIDWLTKNNNYVDYIAHIRPTSPCRLPEVMDDAIYFFSNNNFSSLRSVEEMSESSYKTFEINKSNLLQPICNSKISADKINEPRQIFPKTYKANGYIDILDVEFILKNKLLHGNVISPYITEKIIEVDDIDDFKYLEYFVNVNSVYKKTIFD